MTQLLTIREAAARLTLGKSSVYELIALGDLEVVDIAVKGFRPKTRVPDHAVEAFIKARTRRAPRRPDPSTGPTDTSPPTG